MSFIDSDVRSAAPPHSSGSAIGVAEITHGFAREQLSEYIDGSLPEADRARMNEHLERCRGCRAFKATLHATSEALAELPQEQAPDRIKQRLRRIPQT